MVEYIKTQILNCYLNPSLQIHRSYMYMYVYIFVDVGNINLRTIQCLNVELSFQSRPVVAEFYYQPPNWFTGFITESVWCS